MVVEINSVTSQHIFSRLNCVQMLYYVLGQELKNLEGRISILEMVSF